MTKPKTWSHDDLPTPQVPGSEDFADYLKIRNKYPKSSETVTWHKNKIFFLKLNCIFDIFNFFEKIIYFYAR